MGQDVHDIYDIRKNLLGRWIIVHAHEEGVAWSGSRWVAHYKGVPIAHIQIANFKTPNELHQYALEHIENLKGAPLERTIEATISRDEESTNE